MEETLLVAVDSEWHAEGGKSKRVGDKVWVTLPRKPLQRPPPLSLTVEGHIAPLSERAAGGDFQWSWQHGAWQRHLNSSMLKKLFPVPYISKQVPAECLGIVPGPSWAPTSVCLVHNGQTRNSRATLGSRHRCWAVGGEGTVPFLRQDASSLGWKMQRKGRTRSPLPVVLWNF